jgi:Cu2+-exporting ATPase
MAKTIKRIFPVKEMGCAACAVRVGKTLQKQAGVTEAAVNFATNTAIVEFDPLQTSPSALKTAVQEAGYDLDIEDGEDEDESSPPGITGYGQPTRNRVIAAVALCIPLILVSMLAESATYGKIVMLLLSTPVVFLLGGGFYVHNCGCVHPVPAASLGH